MKVNQTLTTGLLAIVIACLISSPFKSFSQQTLTTINGWVAEMYVQAHPEKIASVVAIQAVKPDDNPAYPAPFATYAKTCGHWLGYEQINDARDMLTIYNTMTAALAGSATYFQTNVGGG